MLSAFCGAALILTSPSLLQAKEFVFTGELLDARTGAPHPDVGALWIELLSRARTPDRRGCDAAYPFERKDRLRAGKSGPGRFTFRIPWSSGACAYQPLNVSFWLGLDKTYLDDAIAYVVNDDGTLNVQERPWALLAPNDKQQREAWLAGSGVVRRGKQLVFAYLQPRYTDLQPAVSAVHDSRAARFYSREDAIRSVYWELFFRKRGQMVSLPERLPAVEIQAETQDFLAWTSPLQWQRHPQPGHTWHYAGVTDPWAWLVEGTIRREGELWQIDVASVPLGPLPPGGTPRFRPTRQFFSAASTALLSVASEAALLEQARTVIIEAGRAVNREVDAFPRQVEHKGLGRLAEVAGDIVVSAPTATVRLRTANGGTDTTSVETFQLDVKPSEQRIIFERPRMIGYEYWTMSDREWGDRICGDRAPDKRPRAFDAMTGRLGTLGGRLENLARCDATDPRGCRLGSAEGRTWYGRCWWDPAAQDVLLGQRALPVRRLRFWTEPDEALPRAAKD